MLPKGLLKEYSSALSFLIRLMDMAVIGLSGFFAYAIKFNNFTISYDYFLAILVAIFITPFIFSIFNIYSSVRGKGLISHFINVIQALMALTIMLAGLAFFTKSGELYSRVWFGLWMSITLFILITYRCALVMGLRFMRTQGMNERRAIIFGAGDLGVKFASTVQEALWTGFKVVAFIDDKLNESTILNIPVIHTPKDLTAYLIQERIDELWLALPLRAEERVKAILHDLRHHPITIRFVLNIFSMDLLNHSIDDVAGFPVLNISSSPMIGMNRLSKAIEDRLIASLILIAISPLLLIISFGVKLSSRGPVLFKQKRLGWDGKIITVYKFRTMYEHQEENNQVTQATCNDKRITPFGKILRRTSLDELPQFINVLQGKMSIVGPRPHALQHNEQFKETVHAYMLRYRVKPGITGWAQVNGWRGETDTLNKMQRRVEYDLYYINNWSLGFDIKIILLTLLRGFTGRNAY